MHLNDSWGMSMYKRRHLNFKTLQTISYFISRHNLERWRFEHRRLITMDPKSKEMTNTTILSIWNIFNKISTVIPEVELKKNDQKYKHFIPNFDFLNFTKTYQHGYHICGKDMNHIYCSHNIHHINMLHILFIHLRRLILCIFNFF